MCLSNQPQQRLKGEHGVQQNSIQERSQKDLDKSWKERELEHKSALHSKPFQVFWSTGPNDWENFLVDLHHHLTLSSFVDRKVLNNLRVSCNSHNA